MQDEAKISSDLEAQNRKQTANMLHFAKAASSCISALKVAAQLSRDAASTFDRERTNMEEKCEEMIAAFGLQPRRWRPGGSAAEIMQSGDAGGGSSGSQSLAAFVRRPR